jgi:Ca-activated chloride channel homolog
MKLARLIGVTAVLAAVALMAVPALGAGFLIPTDESLPPLAIKFLRVDASIDNQAATTRVSQEFINSTSRDLECTYIFPLPKGAAIRSFAMYIGGKRMQGELLKKEDATRVYEEIVRRAKDPGLLEYMDSQLLRLKIFPVPARGTQKVEIEYTEMVQMDEGLAEYVFPMKIGSKASKTLEDFTVSVRIKSPSPIKNVYSPTHEVGVSRPSEHEAVAGMETKGALLDRDFQLFYSVSDKDFGLSLMTYRPDPNQPGMFLALIAPKSEIAEKERVARDLVLVLDTSGSMKGSKIEQAKKALKFCLEKLDRADRFAIVQFSTMAQTYADGWTEATEDNVRKAREWVDKFEAAGGTNFSETLGKVFSLKYDESRPATVFFVTDGRPTVDVTDNEALMKIVKDNNKRGLRMFTFGVGDDDVNTKLLDRMANDSGGLPEYIREGEAMDAKITRLFAKMTHPVLTGLTLEIPKVKIAEMYPKELPDLFRGGQIVVVGTYTTDGDSVIRLKGHVGKKDEEFVYEGTFPKKATDRSFIGSIYAHRKIGFLLDQIRLHGENRELKDEVVRLSLAYGIETPYTSYLVLENEAQYKQYGITSGTVASRDETNRRPPDSGASSGNFGGSGFSSVAPSPVPPASAPAKAMPGAAADSFAKRSSALGETFAGGAGGAGGSVGGGGGPGGGRGGMRGAVPAEAPARFQPPTVTSPAAPSARPRATGDMYGPVADQQRDNKPDASLHFSEDMLKNLDTGKAAVDIATGIAKFRQAEGGKDVAGIERIQNRAGRQFVNFRGVWVDERFLGTEKITKVKWGSEAYFRLLRDKPELKDVFSLGQLLVVVTARGQAVAVDMEQGVEKFTDAEVKAIFTDAPEPKK